MLMLFHQRDTNLLQHFIRSDVRGNISTWLTVEPVAATKTSGMSRDCAQLIIISMRLSIRNLVTKRLRLADIQGARASLRLA
jgi:hypothetical protein